MSYRWIISPVVTISIPDPEGGDADVFRAPKVCEYIEPVRGKRYQHSSVIHADAWALSVVMADDWTPIDADTQCISLLEVDFPDQLHLDKTVRDLGFTTARLNRIKTRLEARMQPVGQEFQDGVQRRVARDAAGIYTARFEASFDAI